ncbi:hypothetical protein [Paucilactobacillus kaifaensis]|uniref:hypothetical protein n=1 Tax=Paucilactobacillus kaifaensis TaxID=2559921 RepID=UPI0010F4B716|nr:hypothetical protein [Paucilactobacillus kaifaensis]
MSKAQLLLIICIAAIIFGGLVWGTLSGFLTGIWLIIAWIIGFVVATTLITVVVAKAQIARRDKEQ